MGLPTNGVMCALQLTHGRLIGLYIPPGLPAYTETSWIPQSASRVWLCIPCNVSVHVGGRTLWSRNTSFHVIIRWNVSFDCIESLFCNRFIIQGSPVSSVYTLSIHSIGWDQKQILYEGMSLESSLIVVTANDGILKCVRVITNAYE